MLHEDDIMSFSDPAKSESDKGTIMKVSQSDHVYKIQWLNKLLSSDDTRMRGMALMVSYIPYLNKENFIENCIKWMQICCTIDGCHGSRHALNNLQALIEESATYPELNNSVSNFLRTKFFGRFFKYFSQLEEGWKCVELCLIYYKGSCSCYQDRLKQALKEEIERIIIPPSTSKVYALLPIIGESGSDGINYTNKWKAQFEELLKISNSILHDLFRDVVESQTYDDKLYEKYCEKETFSEQLLYKLFHNYCAILQYMLLCSFPAPKIVNPQKIFDIICRCLNVTYKTLGNLDTTKAIRLAKVLPQFHIIAYSLVKALIVSCKTHLLPYSLLITKLMSQTIHSTEEVISSGWCDAHFHLRILTYETWRKWTIMSSAADAGECDIMVLAALSDISGENDPHSKAADNLNGAASMRTQNLQNSKTIKSLQRVLYVSALRVLQVYIREVGAKLQVDKLKAIQICVTKTILNIQRTHALKSPYSSSKCRYELYSLLLELVNCQSSYWASPVNWGLDLFKQGLYDSSLEVAGFCSSALANVQNIIDQEVIRVASMEESSTAN